MIGRLMLCLVAVALLARAQFSNTIFQTLSTGIATPSTLGPVTNIGQSQHALYVVASNAPGQSCLGHLTDIFFEASYNGVNFFQLGAARISAVLADSTGTIFGSLYVSGVAPYIRVNVKSFDAANCRLAVHYAGSLFPVDLSKLEHRKLADGLALHTVALATTGTSNIAAVTARSIVVYGLTCSYHGTTPASIDIGGLGYSLVAGQPMVWPPTGIAYYATGEGNALSITNNGTAQLNCRVLYRYE